MSKFPPSNFDIESRPVSNDFNIESLPLSQIETFSPNAQNIGGQGGVPSCGGLGAEPPRSSSGKETRKKILPSKLSISEIRRLYDITPDSSFRESPPPVFEPPAFIKAESGVTPMRIGSALHRITEHIDFAVHRTIEKIEELIAALVEKNLLHEEDAVVIEREKIAELANSPLAERLRKAAAEKKLHRETPFVLALNATELYPGIEENEKILVHGIIDCHFEENGKIIVLDFKSDRIPHSTSLAEWAKYHRVQLKIYEKAVAAATKMEVAEVLLYSFARGEAVAVC